MAAGSSVGLQLISLRTTVNICRALQLATRRSCDRSLTLTPEQIRNLLIHRRSCTARWYLRVIYSVPKVYRQIANTNMQPVQGDCDLTLYLLHWQKSGSKRRETGMRSDNAPELHTIKEVCDLIQEPHSVPIPSTIHSLMQILLSCKLRLAGLSKGGSLNQADDFSPFQVNQTQGLIIFQRPAKSHLGLYFFPFQIFRLYLPVLCIKPYSANAKPPHLLNVPSLRLELSLQKSSSWHVAE